ncbi:TetR/AcrR family transcriptional regulator [Candidatus Izemoplasma sp. B36]|uniref:TetR/AcrR family transcriptional regulator n=1 Tax=Candidatus Izemoplasma sp. B36 TaxID=3242468 RepID=UPI003558D595
MNEMKQKIKDIALQYFSSKGYYGTSIRDISRDAECSLPTVYYYFKNKENLFEELAYKDFIALNERLQGEVTVNENIKDMYLQSILKRLNLKGNDRLVYILAQKTILGLEGSSETKLKLTKWEKERFGFAHYLLQKYYNISEPVYGNILSRVSSNILQKGLLTNDLITNEEVKKEIDLLFELFLQKK